MEKVRVMVHRLSGSALPEAVVSEKPVRRRRASVKVPSGEEPQPAAREALRSEARDIFPPNPGRPAERPSPVAAALELLGGGHSDLSAVRYLREGHNLSLEQAQAAVEAAYQKLSRTLDRAVEHKMALAVEQRCRIAAAALDQSDYRIALSALEQRDKLLGLTGPEVLQSGVAANNLLQLLQLAAGGGNLTGQGAAGSTEESGR